MTIDKTGLETGEFDSYNLDTSEFWTNREESTKSTMNDKLLTLARNGPSSELMSILDKEMTPVSSSPFATHCRYELDLDIADSSGWSPLIHASFNGHTEIVKHILLYQERKYMHEHGETLVDPETEWDENHDENENRDGTELKWKYLIKQFISRKVKWNGSTALHLSSARGHESIVKILIDKMVKEYDMSLDFSVNSIDFDMATPLHCAVLGKHYKICQLLLMNGAIATKKDIRGKTPLDWAKERNLAQYISLLSGTQNQEKALFEMEDKENLNLDDEAAEFVASIWENEERKSMEPQPQPLMTNNNALNYAQQAPSQYAACANQQYFDQNMAQYQQQQQWHRNRHHNNYGAPPPQQAPQPPRNYNKHHQHHHHHHNRHSHFRVRAPRHVRYAMQFNNNYPHHPHAHHHNYAEPQAVTASCSPPTIVQETAIEKIPLEISRSAPVSVKNPEPKEEEKDAAAEKVDCGDPSFDAIKFQNKYLKARCETLEKEHKELATEYAQQLMRENQQWQLREEKIMEQLNAKQKQIHELRHTLRRMRMFLDNLPVRMKRDFYGDDNNFSRELYENKMATNVAKKNGASGAKKSGTNKKGSNKKKSAAALDASSANKNHPKDKLWRRKK